MRNKFVSIIFIFAILLSSCAKNPIEQTSTAGR